EGSTARFRWTRPGIRIERAMTIAMKPMPRVAWAAARAAYLDRMRPWVEERLHRMSRGQKHPVRDFLFEYYSFRPAHLLRWSPGVGVLLENARPPDLEWGKDFTATADGLVLTADTFPAHRVSFVGWAVQYLEGIAARPPLYGCF